MTDNKDPRADEPEAIKEKPKFQERRKKRDWVTSSSTILSLLSWVLALVVWVVLDQASPEKENMFTRFFSVSVRGYWNQELLPLAFRLLAASLCICIIAFIFNMKRKRRKTDKYNKSIIVISIITVISLVLFVVRFGVRFL